jgi:hypothetical protein
MKNFLIATGILAVLAVLLVVGTFAYQVFTPPRPVVSEHTFRNRHAMPQGADLPLGATNIFIATSGVGMGGRAHLMRFHAPLSSIVVYVQKELESSDIAVPQMGPVKTSGPMLQPYGLQHVPWFDVCNIATGFVVRGPEYNSRIYVDAAREFYYYSRTD